MSATALSSSPAIAAFERRRAELLVQRRRATLLYGGLLVLALLVSAWFSEVSPARLADGIPRFGDYQDAMLRDERVLYHAVISPYLNCGLLDPLAAHDDLDLGVDASAGRDDRQEPR